MSDIPEKESSYREIMEQIARPGLVIMDKFAFIRQKLEGKLPEPVVDLPVKRQLVYEGIKKSQIGLLQKGITLTIQTE